MSAGHKSTEFASLPDFHGRFWIEFSVQNGVMQHVHARSLVETLAALSNAGDSFLLLKKVARFASAHPFVCLFWL